MGGCIYDRVASYSIHHLSVNMSCKIWICSWILKNVYLLLSLSYKLLFSFRFLSLTFGLMGCKKGILVFTLLKPIQSSLGTCSFCEKIMDCLTSKRKSWRIVLLLQFLLRSPRAMAGNTTELCVPFRPRTSIKGNTLCLRKSFSP